MSQAPAKGRFNATWPTARGRIGLHRIQHTRKLLRPMDPCAEVCSGENEHDLLLIQRVQSFNTTWTTQELLSEGIYGNPSGYR